MKHKVYIDTYEKVNLKFKKATKKQIRLARKYTRIKQIWDTYNNKVWYPVFKSDNQKFQIGMNNENKTEVKWMCWMFVTALERVLEQEKVK